MLDVKFETPTEWWHRSIPPLRAQPPVPSADLATDVLTCAAVSRRRAAPRPSVFDRVR